MKNNTLFERCKVNTNIAEDVFVGIRKNDDMYEVHFPLGYHLSEDEKGLRKDIISLLAVLARYTKYKMSELHFGTENDIDNTIPVYSYIFLIKDYYERGYYKETESRYLTSNQGKISWSRTIKKLQPVIQDDSAYYLDFVVKKNSIKENELITLIHKYCVHESFSQMGWLFTSFVPVKPKLSLTHKMMISIVNEKLQHTFNDRNKSLFRNMLTILKMNSADSKVDFKYGTYEFEYVWQDMVDRVFGISNKNYYYPTTHYDLVNGKQHTPKPLEPDTIMIHSNKIYVLDSKYYKYGWSGIPSHLPESTSINKQITYGEYIANNIKFRNDGKQPHVYNAFIMPFDSQGKTFPTDSHFHYIGMAKGDWKSGKESYENVVGILLDIKYLMEIDSRLNRDAISELSTIIEKNLSQYLQNNENN